MVLLLRSPWLNENTNNKKMNILREGFFVLPRDYLTLIFEIEVNSGRIFTDKRRKKETTLLQHRYHHYHVLLNLKPIYPLIQY